VYHLAAPKGPIPCVRLGRRCIRFDKADIESYLMSCTHTQAAPTPKPSVRTQQVKVVVTKPQNAFQRLGIPTKPKLAKR